MDLPAGTQLGNYEIISLLGAGGMGAVYLAEDTRLRRKVALKLLLGELTRNEDRVRRFQQEARAVSAINHPNIITIYEIGEVDSKHYIATEFINGPTLRKHLSHNQLSILEVLDIAIQVANALAEAHGNGVVHRDIKPENIMIRTNGLVKVLDFGLAKLTEESGEFHPIRNSNQAATVITVDTDPGTVMGTVTYMSPEQTRAQKIDVRTDIFSIGIVLYEMITGKVPFLGETASDTIASILKTEPTPIAHLRPETPAELQRIVTKSMRKDREERYQTVKDLLIDLKSIKKEVELGAGYVSSAEVRTSGGYSPVSPNTGQVGSGIKSGLSVHTAETVSLPYNQSSAEYIVSGIKKHKRSVGLTLAVLLIVSIAAVAYKMISPSHSIASIAVLPFTNVGDDPANEVISDGLSENLIDQLSQLPGVKVIARSSAFKYKGKQVDPQKAAEELGVHALVMGRVVRRGDDLQVRAELIDAEEKIQIWGQQYNRKATDLQSIQEEIARTIAEKLRLRFTGAAEEKLSKRTTQNPEAYQQYLSGLYYRQKSRTDQVRLALDYYKQAVALDPNFAPAWAGLATTYRSLVLRGAIDPAEGYPMAKAAVKKALDLDPELAEAHVALANSMHEEWDWAGAEREYKRAIELNPNLADAHNSYASFLSLMGRQTEALAENRRAQELDPLQISYRASEGNLLRRANRNDEAIRKLSNVLKLEPDNLAGHVLLGFSYVDKKQYQEAISEFQKVITVEGETPYIRCYLGYALAQGGQRSEALSFLSKLKTGNQYVQATDMATIYAGLGDKDAAIDVLKKGFDSHEPSMRNIKTGMFYDSLHTDPRFVDLVRKMGLTP